MRVLHVHSGNLYGGVETLLLTLARYRHFEPAMESHYALVFEGRLSDDLTKAGVPVYTFGGARIGSPVSIWRVRRQLARLLDAQRFDVVINHSAWPHLIFAPVIRSAGVPLGFWLHNDVTGRHWSERWAARTPPDFAMCDGKFIQDFLPGIFPKVPSEVIHCPVEATQFAYTQEDILSTRRRFGCPDGAVVIVQPSRLEEYKGHRIHLEALSEIKEVPDWFCWIAGEPQRPHEFDYYQGLQTLARKLGIAHRVRFVGWISSRDMQRTLAAAQIHCQPNILPEPFGITFLEGLAAGLPVVSTAFGGAKEIVNDTCGLLSPLNDVRALAQNLRRLIADPVLRSRLGDGGRERAKELCDPERQMARLRWTLARFVSESA